jgi:energy-coupling factor transporter transmembrane protein EcfT
MIIAQKKSSIAFWFWMMMLFGMVVLIFIGANLPYKKLSEAIISLVLVGIIILVVFFVIPIYYIITGRELLIDKRMLKIKCFPSGREISYDLINLLWWEVKPTPGQYQLGRSIYLVLLDSRNVQRKIHIPEWEFTNFEAVLAYFNKEFRKIQKKEKT